MNLINRTYIRQKKAKTEITNKIKTVDKEMRELKGDLWARAVKLNETDAILDGAINIVRYEIYGKKRKNSKMTIDKHKDIDKYMSKLNLIIKDKIELVKVISMVRIDRIMLFIENKANEFNKMMNNYTLCLVDETITYLIKMLRKSKIRLKTISIYQTNCRKALTEILLVKNDDKRNIKEIQKTFSVIELLLKSFESEKVGKERYHTKVDKDILQYIQYVKQKVLVNCIISI